MNRDDLPEMVEESDGSSATRWPFLSGGGELGALMRAHDWSTSPLGSPDVWPQSLRTTVSLMLNSRYPMFVAWGPELAFLYNDGYRPIFGTKHPHTLGLPFAQVWSEIWDDIRPLVDRALAGEATFHENLHLVMERNGFPEDTWYTFSYSPVRDESGDVGGMFCACTETTKIVQAEQENRLERERLAQMFEQAPGCIALLKGPDHRFELTNPAYQRLIGHREVVGAPVAEALPETVEQGFTALLDEVYRSGKAFRSDGARVGLQNEPGGPIDERHLDFVYQPLTDADGQVTGIFVEGQDVTERTRAESELRESEERFRRIADSAPALMWVTQLDRKRSFVNRAYVDFLGISYDDAVDFDWRTILHPDDHDRIVAESIAGEATRQSFVLEARYRRGDGEWRWIRSVSQPRWGPDGEHAGFIGVAHDISDAKEAEAELRTSEDRLKLIQAAGKIGGFDYDLKADDAVCSPEYYAIHGLPPGAPINRDSWTAIIHPDHRGDALDMLNRAAAERQPFSHEYQIVRADTGDVRWLAGRAEVIFDDDGRPWRFVGGVIDITDRVQAEEAARESEARLQLALDAGRIGAWSLDVSDDSAERSPLHDAIFGYSSPVAEWNFERFIGHVAPEDRDWVRERFQSAIESGAEWDFECRIDRADGARRWIEAAGRPVRDPLGDVTGFTGVVVDTTDAREAEEALRQASERAHRDAAERDAILQQLAEGVIVTDAQGRIAFVNAAAAAIHGVEKLDVAPDDYSESYHLFTEDGRPYPPHDLPLARAVLKGQTIRDARWRIRRPDGSEVLAIGSAQPVRGSDGAITGAVLTLRDDTERHAAEEALRDLNETLETRVVAEASERLRAEESLRQALKMEAIGQLTGGIAHDFNNLLTIILNSVELLSRPEISDERRARYISAIGETAERAARLTAQLLAFARRQPLTSEAFDVCERVESMEPMLRTVLGARVELAIETGAVCCVEADPNQFDTAVLNMAVNARDAMPNGGRLTIATAETGDGRHVELRIADTGAGIAPDQVESIFEPFFTTKGVGKGTGLGLSQVYGFARQSGGDVCVESTPGKGATFILSLPHAPHRRGGDPRPGIGTLPAGRDAIPGKGRILVVEDNQDVGEFGGRLLEELGYSVVHADDAEAALALIAEDSERFDAVLSDVVMPGEMDGLALARALRRDRPGLPVILTTGYAHALVEDKGHGFEVLRKPYSIAQLSLLLHEAIDGKA